MKLAAWQLMLFFLFPNSFLDAGQQHQGDITSWYTKNLAQEAESLHTQMLRLFCITEDQWHAYKSSKELTYKQACKKDKHDILHSASYAPCSARTLAFAQQLIVQFNLTHLELYGGAQLLCTTSYSLYLSESFFNAYCSCDGAALPVENQVKVLIVHELMHIRHNDPFIRFCIESYSLEHRTTVNTVAWQEFIGRYNFFIEKRADLQAGLIDSKYATALYHIFSTYRAKNGEPPPSGRHPSMADRCEYLQWLVDYMECERQGTVFQKAWCAVKRNFDVW